jgi:hypothetical protein
MKIASVVGVSGIAALGLVACSSTPGVDQAHRSTEAAETAPSTSTAANGPAGTALDQFTEKSLDAFTLRPERRIEGKRVISKIASATLDGDGSLKLRQSVPSGHQYYFTWMCRPGKGHKEGRSPYRLDLYGDGTALRAGTSSSACDPTQIAGITAPATVTSGRVDELKLTRNSTNTAFVIGVYEIG